jgi:hypothetical protein
MLAELAAPMNAAQRAWATRRARDAARVEIAAIKAGVEQPSRAFDPDKPVVDLWLDDARVGCGQRRYIVLEVGTRWVKLFYPPQLALVTIDRVTFDRHAKPARDAKVRKLARIIRDNVAAAKKINEAAGKPVMPDGGARAKQALQILTQTEGDVCKIGSAFDPAMRLRTCQIANWHKLKLAFTLIVSNASLLESEVCNYLAPRSLGSEWFRIDPNELIDAIIGTAYRLSINFSFSGDKPVPRDWLFVASAGEART